MSRIYTPTDQVFSAASTAFFGSPSNSQTTLPTPTPLDARSVGRVIVNITGGINTSADADPGITNNANATGWIEWLDPGVGWTVIATTSSGASNGGSDVDSTSGPYVVDMSTINNLADIELSLRCRTSANSSDDATSSASAGITAWTIVVNLARGIIGA